MPSPAPKKLVAEKELVIQTLDEILKKVLSPGQKRQVVRDLARQT